VVGEDRESTSRGSIRVKCYDSVEIASNMLYVYVRRKIQLNLDGLKGDKERICTSMNIRVIYSLL
jgi:hypothetical protein